MNQQHTSRRVAAFFDLDGTLVARPSLERRFFAELRYRGAIPMGNYFLWLARAVWLAPRGIQMMRHANKMYLRGVSTGGDASRSDRGQPARPGQGQARMGVPRFFGDAVEQECCGLATGSTILPRAQQGAVEQDGRGVGVSGHAGWYADRPISGNPALSSAADGGRENYGDSQAPNFNPK